MSPTLRRLAVSALLVLLVSAAARGALAATEHPDVALGRPVTDEEMAAWRERTKDLKPARGRMQRLENGGWTIVLPDGTPRTNAERMVQGKPFMPVGIDYEPIALFNGIDWPGVERDLDLMKEDGFNTLTVWCTGFHCTTCTTRHLTIEEMVDLTERARDRGLHIQFYLNIDRFTEIFPRAGMANGEKHFFDIDYADPAYRAFCRNYARRIAMALYPYDNVSTIVVWEEKVGLDIHFDKDPPVVMALYASEAGKARFEEWLRKRHGGLNRLNAAWGTDYASYRDAVDDTLLDYFKGAPKDDHRQFDVLEYGEVILIDFTREFVEAYKEIDPTMLFQCRHFDLFGPVRPLHPGLSFLDSFGVNNYTLGHRGPDFSFREEFVKPKLICGIAGTAAYVGNFGFRAETHDGATHGLVTSEAMKAHFGADSVVAYSFIPEIAGSSYFMYLCPGWEGPWGIVRDAGRERTPIYDAFRAAHTMMAEKNETIARADYASKPRLYVFHGLDAMFDLKPMGWIQHPELSFGLGEMNVNYGVITDTDAFRPSERPAILALFHTYDRKLDVVVLRRLVDYCRRGGTLVIANTFGVHDRYLQPNRTAGKTLRRLRGVEVGELKRGSVALRGEGFPETTVEDTVYVEADPDTLEKSAEVLLTMKVRGVERPALIRQRYGRGTVYYLCFNPFRQAIWTGEPGKENRASLPVLAFLCRQLGVPLDSRLGNRGYDLANGRVNIHEKLSTHAFVNRELEAAGMFNDEYGETGQLYSGGVITDDILSFRGRRLDERGWSAAASAGTSLYAWTAGRVLSFVTLDPVELVLGRDGWKVSRTTEAFRVYRIPLD